MTFPPRTYTTQDEAVLREIVEPIENCYIEDAYAEFDVKAIADEILTYDPDEFWDIVERHAR